MERRHARYPLLRAAREAVEAADIDLAALVADGGAPVERARERVETAIEEGTVGAPRETRVEVLSYPIARVLVSLVDERALTRRYANAEAATAFERLGDDLRRTESSTDPFLEARQRPGRQGEESPAIGLGELLADFDLDGAVRETGEGYRVRVARYVSLAAGIGGEQWRLVNRSLDRGWVPVSREELLGLLRQAIRDRVAEDLPLEVPDAVAEPLGPVVESIRGTLADLDLARDIDTVVPELFPPCMKQLLERVRAGEHLEHHSRFAITSFLASIGLSTDEIVELYAVTPGFGEEVTRYQTEHIRGETGPTQYDPPSCATMQTYGDCVNKDDICEQVINESHPLNYYEHRLEEADDPEDWRG